MNSKVTLSFDTAVIEDAKAFAKQNGISLSRLTEFLYRQVTSGHYESLDELPIPDWVNAVAEGKAEYRTKARKNARSDFYEKR